MRNREDKIMAAVSHIVLMLFAIICVVPILMIIIVSITSEQSITQYGFQFIPKELSISAYKFLVRNPTQVLNAYKVTIIVTVTGTLLSLIFSSQFAYVLSRKIFIFQSQFAFLIYFTMLFNGGLVPTYILVTRYLQLKNSLWAIIVTMMVSPWNIFMLRTFITALPESLIESAKIDGASEFRVFYQIVAPLCKGGLATVAITVAMAYWNDWYQNMLYISDADKYSLQYMLQTLLGKIDFIRQAGQSGQAMEMELPKESLRMATCIVAAGPMICLFFFFQKYFVSGITVGAVKG